MSPPAWYERFGRLGKRLSLAERYYERGLFQYEKNRLDLAVADLDEAIQAEPKRAEFYVARGLMLLQSGRPDEAEEDFAFGLELDPKQWLAHYGRGMHAFDRGDYTGAIGYFSRAQRVAPDRPEIYLYRGVAFHQNGQPDEAARDLEVAEGLFKPEDKRAKLTARWLTIVKK
jgi:Flp pilus assembly protein TadD